MTPKHGTTRYEKLADFLERVMEDTRASRRVRLSAAQRLDDLLARQERREDAEARREERKAQRAAKACAEALERETHPTAEEVEARKAEREHELAVQRANQHLKELLKS